MLTWLTADVVSAPCRRLTRGDLYFFFKLYFKVLTFREFIYVCTNAILVSLIGFDRCKEKPNANLVTMWPDLKHTETWHSIEIENSEKTKTPNFCFAGVLTWWIHYHQHFNSSWKQNSVEYSSICSFFETTLAKQGNYNWTGKLFSRIWATYVIRNVSLSKHNTRKDKKDGITKNLALYLLNYTISLNIDRIYVLQTVNVYNSTSM